MGEVLKKPGDVQEESPYLLGVYDPRNYLPWSGASLQKLEAAERSLLSIVTVPYEFKQVKVSGLPLGRQHSGCVL